jgi:H+/Cl- antiporter ClcA
VSLENTRPADADLGLFILLVPVIGATIVGLMARYGSERIRGHGIPEALEAILINGSRVEPKVAVLKPLSAAISIGSGGPFGAEGPIIMTGGSFGSLAAQCFHLSSAERKTLLVAGAAAGMSATFASPFAAVLLAVELLLFEWKPRSLVPVAVASLTAFIVRRGLLGAGPLFPETHVADLTVLGMAACVVVGLAAGAVSAGLTSLVYLSEDAFKKLPIHWMWWPTLGGVAIGIGGLFFPRALGVGYDTIDELLQGDLAMKTMLGVLIVKALIWSISLGSGTSGGVLAPLLMMGAAVGGIEASVLPADGAGYWPLLSMAAVLGGTMRSPLTAVIFALELTHDLDMMAPLLAATVTAHAFTVLVMKRSILTEKVSRRGLHLSREYSVDPLELHFVREVMETSFATIPAMPSADDLAQALAVEQDVFPVVEATGLVSGVVLRHDIAQMLGSNGDGPHHLKGEPPDYVHPNETLRYLAHRMARTKRTRLLVSNGGGPGDIAGIVTLRDLLKAWEKNAFVEEHRQRHIVLTLPRRSRNAGASALR